MTKITCETCMYLGQTYATVCRRCPPTLFVIHEKGYSEWPSVDPKKDWCGEYRQRPAPEQDRPPLHVGEPHIIATTNFPHSEDQ